MTESTTSVTGLKTEHSQNPLGIDLPPRFSWSHDGAGRQRAYRILAASQPEFLAQERPDVWDSKRVESAESQFLPFGGKPLTSGQRVFWRVQTWSENGTEHISEVAWFEMGLLHPADWQGQFIAPRYCGVGGRGYHSRVLPAGNAFDFWVQVDLGRLRSFDRLALHPVFYRNWGIPNKLDREGFGFPRRFRVETAEEETFAAAATVFETPSELENPRLKPYEIRLPTAARARFVRITVIAPYTTGKEILFALDELQIFSGAENLALGKPVTASNSVADMKNRIVANAWDWHADCLTDGIIHIDEPRHDQGAGNLLRRAFAISKPVVSARAYIGSRGWHELRINGQKAGDAVLDSAWTNFDRRILYSTWDVTALLAPGENVVAITLSDGWCAQPAVILQLQVRHPDGTRTVLCSDETWRVAKSPVVAAHVFHGETHDARLEYEALHRPAFNDQALPRAVTIPEYRPALSAQMNPPIRVTKTMKPVALTEPQPGVWVFDLGQNIAGWVRLRVNAEAGCEITLRFAEVIFDDGAIWTDAAQTQERQDGRLVVADGMINAASMRSARATDHYLCAGDPEGEVWEPRFTYHGFRFVEVTGLAGPANLSMIEGRVVHTDIPSTGHFECSHEVLNWAQEASRWTLLCNLHSVPTDCPQRDERQGWMGDAQVVSEAMLCNFDAASTYRKWMRDMRDDQREDGAVGDTTPHSLGRMGGDLGWGCACIMVPWHVYLYTGDRQILREQWDCMHRYLAFLDRLYPERFVDKATYGGDWLAVEATPHQLTNTCLLLLCARIVAHIAGILGRPAADIARWKKLEAEATAVFQQRFFDPVTGGYGLDGGAASLGTPDENDSRKTRPAAGGSQFANALALYLGVVPETLKEGVMHNLVQNIEARNRHLSTGVLGTKVLLEALCTEGRADLALAVASAPDYPGYGFMRAHQATTLWEHWELKTGNAMNSHNHPWTGCVSAWMMRHLAGIQPTVEQPGFRRILFAPQFPDGLDFAAGKMETRLGLVSSSWQRTEDHVRLEVRIPDGSEGEVSPPPNWRLKRNPGPGPETSAVTASRARILLNAGAHSLSFSRRRIKDS